MLQTKIILSMKIGRMILVCGNPLLGEDRLPLELADDLKTIFPHIVFEIIDPNENLKPIDGHLDIIDTVADINKVTVITNIDMIADGRKYSAHDLDLGFNLKLLEKTGKLKSVTIFGVPMGIKKRVALAQLTDAIRRSVL